MKKKKLFLKKEIIATLSSHEMQLLIGGETIVTSRNIKCWPPPTTMAVTCTPTVNDICITGTASCKA